MFGLRLGRRRSLAKSVLAGVAGGLAASYAMNQFQHLWLKLGDSRNGGQRRPEALEPDESAPATVKAGTAVVEAITHEEPSREVKKALGPAVHYVFGAGMGALYGIASEYKPVARAGFGTGYGTAVFVAADEIGVPLMGLSKLPAEVPLGQHLYAWVSHVVYGATLEGVRRLTRKALAA